MRWQRTIHDTDTNSTLRNSLIGNTVYYSSAETSQKLALPRLHYNTA